MAQPWFTVQTVHGLNLTPYCEGIKVRMSQEKDDKLTVELGERGFALMDNPALKEGRWVYVRWGLRGIGTSPRYRFVIDGFSAEPGVTTRLTLECSDGAVADRKAGVATQYPRQAFNKLAATVAKNAGLRLSISAAVKGTAEVGPITVGPAGAVEALRGAAYQLGPNVEVVTRNGTLYVRERPKATKPERQLTLGGGTLISFRVAVKGAEKRGSSKAVTVTGIDAMSGEPYAAKATEPAAPETRQGSGYTEGMRRYTLKEDGARVVEERVPGSGPTTETRPGGPSRTEAGQRAAATMATAATKEITAEFSLSPEPSFVPGLSVSVRGVGKLYSGVWLIPECTHSIGRSGYELTGSAGRNAVQAQGAAPVPQGKRNVAPGTNMAGKTTVRTYNANGVETGRK